MSDVVGLCFRGFYRKILVFGGVKVYFVMQLLVFKFFVLNVLDKFIFLGVVFRMLWCYITGEKVQEVGLFEIFGLK